MIQAKQCGNEENIEFSEIEPEVYENYDHQSKECEGMSEQIVDQANKIRQYQEEAEEMKKKEADTQLRIKQKQEEKI